MRLSKTYSIYLIPVFLCIFVLSLYAQEALTLKQVLNLAKENNITMIKARKNIESAKARLIKAGKYSNPEINADSYISPKGENSYEFVVNQEFDLLGKVGIRKSIAEDEVTIAGEEMNLAWSEVTLVIKEAYYEILLMEKRKDITQENLQLFRKLLDMAQLRYNSGEILLSEVTRAKIELSQAENEYYFADKELRTSKAKFNFILNKPADFDFIPGDSIEYEEIKFDYSALYQKALLNNPEIKARTMHAKINRKEFDLVKKDVFSNPAIGFGSKKETGETSTGASISIVLPFWYRNTGEIKEAAVEMEKLSQDIEYFKKQLEVDIFNACIETEYIAKQVANFKKNLEQSNYILNQINLQYKEGKVELFAYLDNMKTVKNVRLGYYEAVLGYNKKIALIEKLLNAEL